MLYDEVFYLSLFSFPILVNVDTHGKHLAASQAKRKWITDGLVTQHTDDYLPHEPAFIAAARAPNVTQNSGRGLGGR